MNDIIEYTHMGFESAIDRNNIGLVKEYLRNKNIYFEFNENYAMRKSSYEGFTDIVELLLIDGRSDPAVFNNYPLRQAALEGHIDIIKLLLKDSRITMNSIDPLVNAIKANNIEIVKLFLKHSRIKVNQYHNEAIIVASHNKYIDIVNLLWKESVVKNSLQSDHKELYNSLSIKDKVNGF
jgi:ankyrin repeat protein